MTDYRPRRGWDRGDETSRGSFGYEGEVFMHGGGRDFSGDTYGATYGWERDRGRPSYRGLGPKNYRRSDDRIREDVCERLAEDDRIDASDLEVHVQDSIVTLTGSIADRDMKRRAEDVAESITGVRDVQNQVRVAR